MVIDCKKWNAKYCQENINILIIEILFVNFNFLLPFQK